MNALDAYLARIGHTGPRTPSLATLAAIHAAHVAAIPFENLDPLLGRPVALDIDSLQKKLVSGGRGGYCYEHNLLFGAMLRALGFTVTDLAARVVWNAPAGAARPRTHMLLAVDIDGARYIADTGFGGMTLTEPLRFGESAAQQTAHGRFQLSPLQHGHQLQAEVRGDWQLLYQFDLQPQWQSDYEMASWYLCHHPQSHFVNALLAGRAGPEGRHALLNNRLNFYPVQGETRSRILTNAADLCLALQDVFLIDVSTLTGLESQLDLRLDEWARQPSG